MEYKDFTDRQTAYDGFIKYRRQLMDCVEKGNFFDEFTELCARAMGGDCVAQDCVAYFFSRGVPGVLLKNYDYYMSWQILAGANGNMFALEKLEFFLNSALEEIVGNEEILSQAFYRRNITKDNALMVISNLLCEGIVDQLQLDPKKLVRFDNKKEVSYSPQINRPYLTALDDCFADVVDFLVS